MKVAIINTTERKGGAAVACNRLHEALRANGIESTMVVREKAGNDPHVVVYTPSKWKVKFNIYLSYADQLVSRLFKRDKYGAFSETFFGNDISRHPVVKNADIIHIHWVQNSYLRIKDIEKLASLGKPVFWTLHDMWAFTGGCHYNEGCIKFESECHHCPQLKYPSKNDISSKQFKRKLKLFNRSNFHIITPSVWMNTEARVSTLLKSKEISIIPYNINTELFKEYPVTIAREEFNVPLNKKLILFVAMSVRDERKGFALMQNALLQIIESDPDFAQHTEIMVIGRFDASNMDLKIKIHSLGRISNPEILAKAYAASDIFIAPSIQDNLPNTVIESLSCGTPVVAFNIGGMPDMIDHQHNGYLAEKNNIADLAEGIKWTLNNAVSLKMNTRKKVLEHYNTKKIAEQHLRIYSKLK